MKLFLRPFMLPARLGIALHSRFSFPYLEDGRWYMLPIEPIVKMKVIGEQAVGNGSYIDAVIDSAFEGQGMLALTQQERTDRHTSMMQQHLTIAAWAWVCDDLRVGT